MTILVIGRSGQVARALQRQAEQRGVTLRALGRPELDLEDDASVERAVDRLSPNIVINAAAYTAVDRAEDEPKRAWQVNARAAGVLSLAAQRCGASLIHLSTDYVFSGAKATPYCEGDETEPTGVYGASKLEGERLVLDSNPRSIVLRTAWVFDVQGANFVRTMLRLALTREEIPVVDDQIGCPTFAEDLAEALLTIAAAPRHAGVYHCVGGGETTWFGFAQAVFALAGVRGGPAARAKPIQSAEYPTRARRPANSRLNCDKIAADYGVRLRPWDTALPACIDQIAAGWRVG